MERTPNEQPESDNIQTDVEANEVINVWPEPLTGDVIIEKKDGTVLLSSPQVHAYVHTT
jgi:hypothetical protein